ncbi:unnamed protein product [Arctia plantaginis]|uniref:Uncharacterized protein n=1 Tax=Arctia plantaginis TaxID=874455 RepID=A0A8S0ZLK1_ARCPL|nr:unnamed protein product [Arctia plantaginis]
MYLGVFVFGIFSVSALAVPNSSKNQFKYVHSLYRRSDDCNLCYGEDCLPFDQVRCDYYSEADTLLPKGEEPEGFMDLQLRNEVDSLMYDIAEKVNQSQDLKCIPHISRYTDCTKENVCLGCKTCSCDKDGYWHCKTSHCHMQASAIDVDHRVLIMTIENLNANIKLSREKRSATDNPFENINGSTLEQLTEWIYGVTPNEGNTKSPNNEELGIIDTNIEPFSVEQQNLEQSNTNATPKNDITSTTTEAAITPQSEHTAIPTVPTFAITTDSEYIAFDEVLSNIGIDSKNYSRRKSLLDFLPNYSSVLFNKTTEFDYMLLDDDKTTDTVNIDIASEMPYVVDFAKQSDATEPTIDEATKVVINLLDSAKKAQLFNDTDYVDMSPNKDNLVGVGFDNTNDIFEYNQMNIMKREVSGVTEATRSNDTYATDIRVITINYTENQTPPANQENKNSLKNSVLLPLTKLINSRRNELDDLIKIKVNLISFMNYYNESPIVEIIDYPNISDSNILHDVEMFPDMGYDLRRTNPDVMQKFLYKLKADIYEVIKDIIGLERYREGNLPDDLSLLIHSLKRYASKSKSHKKHQKTSKNNNKPTVNNRRTLNPSNNKCTESTFRQCMVEILQAVDKDMPKTNALGSLSPTMRRILRHVIEAYNNGVYDTIGHKVHDPNYSMTNDLKDIGSNWQEIANNAIGSSPHETMYKMKLLHYLMEKDISKINDALAVIDFARSRRMIPFFKSVSNDVFQHINKGLKSVHNNVEVIVQYHAKNPRTLTNELKDVIGHRLHAEDVLDLTTTPDISGKYKHKKMSFIKHIRNLLKSSKKDISELLHRQVPKSEIVKQLAKQKLNEIAQKRYDDYEKTMKTWQKNLGLLPIRYKRDLHPDQIWGRIKNIIPNYLRHKVHPKIKNNRNSTKKKNKHKKKRENHKKLKKTTLTTATTPNTKTTRRSITTRRAYKTTGTTANVKNNRSVNKN